MSEMSAWRKPGMPAWVGVPTLALAFALCGCSAALHKPDPPTVTLERLRIESVAGDEMRATVSLLLSNPNDVEIALDGFDVALDINGATMTTGRLAAPLRLPARGSGHADFSGMTSIVAMRSAMDAALRFSNVSYALTGTAVVNGWTLPFARRGETNMANLLRGIR